MGNEIATDFSEDDTGARGHIHQMWAAVADSWAEYAEYTDTRHADETALMLDLTSPQSGERVLELACGAGGLGLAAAARVGASGEVVVSDVAAEMTVIASARAATRGLTNVRTRVLDLEAIDEPDARYDVVLSRDGLQFTLQPARAIREIARILRPGGRVCVAVWGPRERNPWLAVVLDAASAQLGRPIPPPGVPGPFSLTDRSELRNLLFDAGLTRVVVSDLSVPMRAVSFDEWWARTSARAGPLAAILAGLPPVAADELRSRAHEASRAFETPAGLEFDGMALVATGTRPRE
jgi:ubiquinone/menaquinone biosynthesis C-methylase UbiE